MPSKPRSLFPIRHAVDCLCMNQKILKKIVPMCVERFLYGSSMTAICEIVFLCIGFRYSVVLHAKHLENSIRTGTHTCGTAGEMKHLTYLHKTIPISFCFFPPLARVGNINCSGFISLSHRPKWEGMKYRSYSRPLFFLSPLLLSLLSIFFSSPPPICSTCV